MTAYTPTSGRILVERLTEQETTEGGIVRPTSARSSLPMARVLRVAEDVDEVAPGDVVLVGAYPGQEMDLDGRAVLWMLIDEVLGVVDDCDAA